MVTRSWLADVESAVPAAHSPGVNVFVLAGIGTKDDCIPRCAHIPLLSERWAPVSLALKARASGSLVAGAVRKAIIILLHGTASFCGPEGDTHEGLVEVSIFNSALWWSAPRASDRDEVQSII